MSPDLSLLKEKTLENLLNIDDADESGDFSNRNKLKPENIKKKIQRTSKLIIKSLISLKMRLRFRTSENY